MLRAIDRFIAAVRRGEGEEIVFATGQPIRIRNGQQMRVLLAQPVRSDQIQAILKDVVPVNVDSGFTSDGEASFTFDAPGGPVSCHVRRLQGRVDAVLRPAASKPAPPPPSQSRSTTAVSNIHIATNPSSSSPSSSSPSSSSPSSSSPSSSSPSSSSPSSSSGGWGASWSGPSSSAAPATAAAAKTAVFPAPNVASVATAANAPAAPQGRRQIDPLLHSLVQMRASDLHLTAGLQPRVRKDGDIQVFPGYEGAALSSDAIRTMLMELAPVLARERFERSNDADFAYEIPGLARFRVNAFKDRKGVSGVLRVIPSKILTADELGLTAAVRELCTLTKGLVVVTGPTGSGKSTTLAAMIDLVNKTRQDHIITIEDPVEFVHESQGCLVNQREVHVDTDSFQTALRAALREDPDIVLVGELRDLETVAIAIETAETGHLVFGTLHTNTAVSTVDRIIDQFPTDRQSQIRIMLSESLKAVIAQTLCKKIGGGRVAAYEILISSTAVANLIREAKTFQIPSLMQTQKQAGMLTLNDSLFALVKEGLVTPEEAHHKSVDRHSFKLMLDRAQIKLGAK